MSSLARIRERVLRLGADGLPVRCWEGRFGGTMSCRLFGTFLWRFGFAPTSTVARQPPLVRPFVVSAWWNCRGRFFSRAVLVTIERSGSYTEKEFAPGRCWQACLFLGGPLRWGDGVAAFGLRRAPFGSERQGRRQSSRGIFLLRFGFTPTVARRPPLVRPCVVSAWWN
jgi:hypothetical protein